MANNDFPSYDFFTDSYNSYSEDRNDILNSAQSARMSASANNPASQDLLVDVDGSTQTLVGSTNAHGGFDQSTALFYSNHSPDDRVGKARSNSKSLSINNSLEDVTRFSNRDNGEPWNPVNLRVPSTTRCQDPNPSGRSCSDGATVLGIVPGNRPPSEIGGNITSGSVPDSGYATNIGVPHSVTSVEPSEYGQDCSDLRSQLGQMHPYDGSFHSSVCGTDRNPEQPYESFTALSSQRAGALWSCDHCTELFKCSSDLKKHRLKFVKPYKCTEPNCSRKGDGFRTPNDLERHQKSVHNIQPRYGSSKSWKCPSVGCKVKEKVWPRWDNFKQHVLRVHKNEDTGDLLRRSQIIERTAPSVISQSFQNREFPSKVEDFNQNSADICSNVASNSGASDAQGAEVISSGNQMEAFPSTLQGETLDYSMPGEVLSYPTGTNFMETVEARSRTSSANGREPLRLSTSMADSFHVQHCHGSTYELQRAASSVSYQDQQLQYQGGPPEDGHFQLLSRISDAIASELKDRQDRRDSEPLNEFVLRILDRQFKPSRKRAGPDHHAAATGLVIDSFSPGSASDVAYDGGLSALTTAKDEQEGLQFSVSKRQRRGYNVTHAKEQTSPGHGVKCPDCSRFLDRPCDLNKHRKRHTKPYGCTFPNCYKKFGSKGDWKRHENTQHFQPLLWRCRMEREQGKGNPCAHISHRRELFEQHLSNEHQLDELRVEEELKECKIGRNCLGRFWCGFCNESVELKETGLKAWDERFNHIDEHLKHEKIDNWLCLEKNKPIGALRKHTTCQRDFDDDAEEVTSEEPRLQARPRLSAVKEGVQTSYAAGRSQTNSPSHGRRDPPSRWPSENYCCTCGYGPWSTLIHSSCTNCQHNICDGCTKQPYPYQTTS